MIGKEYDLQSTLIDQACGCRVAIYSIQSW